MKNISKIMLAIILNIYTAEGIFCLFVLFFIYVIKNGSKRDNKFILNFYLIWLYWFCVGRIFESVNEKPSYFVKKIIENYLLVY